MEAIPIGIFWCITVWSIFQQRHVLIYLFFSSMPFGSFAAIPTNLTGGLTLTPTPIIATILIAKELMNSKGLRIAIADALKPTKLLYLFIFWIIALVSAFFMPRFFSNQVQVIPVRGSGPTLSMTMLEPTTQNISTSIYVSLSTLTVFVFAKMLRSLEMRRHALNALCLGAIITVITGFVDFISQYLNIQPILEVFRTASYALMAEDEILDAKRVVGLMTEASAFGGLTLNFLAALYFIKRAMPDGHMRNRIVPILIILLSFSIWLSTSSSAYLGLAIFGIVAVIEWFWRLLSTDKNPYLQRGLQSEFFFAASGLSIIFLIFLLAPHLFDPIVRMIDVLIFQKSGTSSFEDRNMTTEVSWNSLFSTYGLGVGLGGTRASNFAVAIVSNVGIMGTACYILFLINYMFFIRAAKTDAQGKTLIAACRWSYLPAFFASLTVGTTPDFGFFNSFLYGFAIAITFRKFAINQSYIRAN